MAVRHPQYLRHTRDAERERFVDDLIDGDVEASSSVLKQIASIIRGMGEKVTKVSGDKVEFITGIGEEGSYTVRDDGKIIEDVGGKRNVFLNVKEVARAWGEGLSVSASRRGKGSEDPDPDLTPQQKSQVKRFAGSVKSALQDLTNAQSQMDLDDAIEDLMFHIEGRSMQGLRDMIEMSLVSISAAFDDPVTDAQYQGLQKFRKRVLQRIRDLNKRPRPRSQKALKSQWNDIASQLKDLQQVAEGKDRDIKASQDY